MKSLKQFVNENLLQPDDIGMPTDGFFRLIELGSNSSLIKNEKDKQLRTAKRIFDIDKQIEKTR